MLENKINYSIYLLKDEFVKNNRHLQDVDRCQQYSIPICGYPNAEAYLKIVPSKHHSWRELLPTEISTIDWNKYRTRSFYGILFIEVNSRLFALTSGFGRYLLHPFSVENRFGFKAVLNSIDPQTIQQLSKMTLEQNPKKSIEQVTKGINLNQFGIDGFTDLVQRIKGRSKIENLGLSLDGEDALKISVAHELHEFPELLKECLSFYSSNEYKRFFPEVDNLSLVKDKEQNSLLNREFEKKLVNELQLVSRNNDLSGDIWAAIPEVLLDDGFDCYTYKGSEEALRFYDIELKDIFCERYLSKNKTVKRKITLTSLSHDSIFIKKTDGSIHPKWSAVQCLNAIIEYGQEKFFFIDRQWFRASASYIDALDRKISQIPKSNLFFSDWPQHMHEKDYLESHPLTYHKSYMVLDRKNICLEGQTPVEPCDIYTQDKRLIHLKRYGSSAVLGHLFNQGYVSGDLLLNSVEFKDKLNEKLDDEYKLKEIIPSEFTIAYVISSKYPENVNLPLFSKITLTKAYDELRKKGFNVTLDIFLTTLT